MVTAMMGVVKLLDNAGRVRDEAPWFGGSSGLRFGEMKRHYTLMRVILATSDGKELEIPMRPMEVKVNHFPVIYFRVARP